VLNETNFKESIAGKKIIVMFYREEGCSFCDKAKPIFESYQGYEKGMYALGYVPDSINEEFPIERFPTFYAFDDGKAVNKIEGVPTHEKLNAMFAPQGLKIENASMEVLLKDESIVMDKIYPLAAHLKAIRAEIARRKEVISGL
jgi:thioredoxin-like negative regulator of GroEL